MSQDMAKDDLTDLLHKIQSNLVDDVDDFNDHISDLKGILNETLGGLPFKFAILLVVFLNFLYTSYDAFFATRITSMITNECYCDPTDRNFYRIVMMVSMIFWISFLFIYGVYSTCGRHRIVCAYHNETKTGLETDKYVSKTHEDLVKLLDVLKRNEKKFQAQLRELVTTKFLDDDHCESIQQHYYSTSLYWKKTDTHSSADPHISKICENGKQDDTGKSNSSQANRDTMQATGLANTIVNCNTNNVLEVDIESVQVNAVQNTVQAGIGSAQGSNGQNNTVQAGHGHGIESPQANNGEDNAVQGDNDIESAQASNGENNTVQAGNGHGIESPQANNGENNTVQAGHGHGIESPQANNGENNAVQPGYNDIESAQASNGENNTERINTKQDDNNTDSEHLSQGRDDLGQVTKINKQSSQTTRRQSNRWYCFMFLKISLIALRFVFRLLIVPLLQLQLFNDYAWYCLLNNIVRNYCETETNKYYIGLDHSLVNYCVYILLLIALLFSFLINWFPKGIPQVVLLYKAGRIMINKKGQFKSQIAYKQLVNEPDTD